MKRTIGLWLTLVVFGGIGFWCVSGGGNEKSDSDMATHSDTVNVRTAPVVRDSQPLAISAAGKITASSEIKLAFKTGGYVKYMIPSEVTRVKKGRLLAALDTVEIKASVAKAQSMVGKARRDLTRVEKLFADSVVTEEQMQNARTAFTVAIQDLKIAQFNLRHSLIRAPSDGRILYRLTDTHEMVAPGTPAFLFASDAQGWIVTVALCDKDIILVSPDDSAVVQCAAIDTVPLTGKVTHIGEFADPYTGTYTVEVSLDKTGHILKSGFIGTVSLFPRKTRNLARVPLTALVGGEGRNGLLYSVDENQRVTPVPIHILRFIGNDMILSHSLKEITHVVTDGAAYVKDARTIKVVD